MGIGLRLDQSWKLFNSTQNPCYRVLDDVMVAGWMFCRECFLCRFGIELLTILRIQTEFDFLATELKLFSGLVHCFNHRQITHFKQIAKEGGFVEFLFCDSSFMSIEVFDLIDISVRVQVVLFVFVEKSVPVTIREYSFKALNSAMPPYRAQRRMRSWVMPREGTFEIRRYLDS